MDFTYYTDEFDYQDVITIEYLRQFYSCSSCGVSWQDDHFTFDCDECGDFSMTRPCSLCDGKCGAIFTRNLALTHEKNRACWEGECKLIKNNAASMKNSCLSLASKSNLKTNLNKTTLNSAASFIQTGLKVS